MSARAVLIVLLAVAAASLCALGLDRAAAGLPGRTGVAGRSERIVSLSPALTDTLFAVGAGARVVGVTDYCDYPPEVHGLPRVGTGLLPGYERIAALGPTLILAEASSAPRRSGLSAIAETHLLPWLEPHDVIQGIATVGVLSGEASRGRALAAELSARLSRPVPDGALRVLLVFGYGSIRDGQVWFARPESLHGAALAAAGARNAVDTRGPGPPSLALERLLAVDPDAIVVLASRPGGAAGMLSTLNELTALRAVQHGRVRALESAAAFSAGPRILTLIDELEGQLEALEQPR